MKFLRKKYYFLLDVSHQLNSYPNYKYIYIYIIKEI